MSGKALRVNVDTEEADPIDQTEAISSASHGATPTIASVFESDNSIVDFDVLRKWRNNPNAPHVFSGLAKLVGKAASPVINPVVQVLHHWNEHKAEVWKRANYDAVFDSIWHYGNLLLDMDTVGSKRASGDSNLIVSAAKFATHAAEYIGPDFESNLASPGEFLVAWLKELSRNMNCVGMKREPTNADRESAEKWHEYFIEQEECSWISERLVSQIQVDQRCKQCGSLRGHTAWEHKWSIAIDVPTVEKKRMAGSSRLWLGDLFEKKFQNKEMSGKGRMAVCSPNCEYVPMCALVLLPPVLIVTLNRQPGKRSDMISIERILRLATMTTTQAYSLVSCIYSKGDQFGVLVFEDEKITQLVDDKVVECKFAPDFGNINAEVLFYKKINL